MNLAQQLLTALKAYGIKEIFGIPGDFALPLFKVIEETQTLPLYTLSHEPAVGFAADAAARFHTRPSVAAVTYGAGALNMVNPIAAAYAEKSPVIVISGGPGQADKSTGLLVHHQAKQLHSQVQVYKEVTCDQVVLDDTAQAPAQIARALKNCIIESRPVYIEVPRDQVFEPCDPVPVLPLTSDCDTDALDACTDEIIEALGQAASPVLMVGVEIRRYGLEQEVALLSRKLGIPVVTTFMGKGLLAGQPVDLRGTYMGVAGEQSLTQLVERSDGLFLLGVLLSDTNFGISEKKIDLRKTVLACDGSVSLGFHVYPSIPLQELVRALNDKLPERPQLEAARFEHPRGLALTDEPITPTDIATAVNDMFHRYGALPIASDMGDCLFTAMDMEYTELVAPGYYATMGYGVPSGLGVQAATGRRPLILVGDGAFQMTGMELLNCRRYGWNPIVLVFNNSSWEMLRAFQPESEFNDLDRLDFAALADALGGLGQAVNTKRELHAALDRACADETCFQLIDISLARGLMSNTLSRFVAGFKQMRDG
ncbi:MAG: indolepyruvate/phenylpyruvate decarboxylase [Gammaproteobacteria bacterium]|nr:indolepyruvate/phenylpyruvate decarboxylase [Gammaproteobacteria bacterium]MCY4281504.1 indolepyruvate/phenylpyruvate decarboxylase [Gammaproteobacteria bacterium]